MDEKRPLLQAILDRRRWLVPGLHVKRWLLLLAVGVALTGIGLVYLAVLLNRAQMLPDALYGLLALQFLTLPLRVLLPLVLGTLVILLAVVQLGRNLLAPFRDPDQWVADSLYDYRRRGRGPRIVAIGGGTGLPTLLRGLTGYTRNITAIVTVADDGGSSGRLRRDLGLLPPGDFRNNLAALARDEALMTQVLQYRFGGRIGENGDSGLQGHAFGNLLLAALTGITGSFDEALLAAQRVLAIRGQVVPSTLESVSLAADVVVEEAGKQLVREHVVGESTIPKSGGRIQRIALEPAEVTAYPAAIKAIFQADLILLGPGSLYTSILPNLLVPDLGQAVVRAPGLKVYVCNLATQPGETVGYNVSDHIQAILDHMPSNFLDFALANSNLSVPPDAGGGHTVFVQPQGHRQVPLITADLVDSNRPWRHDSRKLAAAVIDLLTRSGKR